MTKDTTFVRQNKTRLAFLLPPLPNSIPHTQSSRFSVIKTFPPQNKFALPLSHSNQFVSLSLDKLFPLQLPLDATCCCCCCCCKRSAQWMTISVSQKSAKKRDGHRLLWSVWTIYHNMRMAFFVLFYGAGRVRFIRQREQSAMVCIQNRFAASELDDHKSKKKKKKQTKENISRF